MLIFQMGDPSFIGNFDSSRRHPQFFLIDGPKMDKFLLDPYNHIPFIVFKSIISLLYTISLLSSLDFIQA